VLARFLRSLGVDRMAIPDDAEERAALYRSRLADRRLLILLDNAECEAQLRPLLPGAPGCAVLMTSRTRLAGLSGARLIDLDIFEPDQAVLARRAFRLLGLLEIRDFAPCVAAALLDVPARGTDPSGWFKAEWAALVGVVEQAYSVESDQLDDWALGVRLARIFLVRGYYDDWRHVCELMLAGARRAVNNGRKGERYGAARSG
jgi:hypothetical protein